MAFDTAYPQILANLAAGNEPIAIVDSNFTPLYNALLAVGTYSTYYVDSGAANAYVITITARQSLALAAGLRIQFKAANANTGASTLNANGTGAKNILRVNGGALVAGDIPANGIIDVMYDGTQYLVLSGLLFNAKTLSFTRSAASASGNVAYTGAGFKPKAAIFLQAISGTTAGSFGVDDGVTAMCVYQSGGTLTPAATGSSIVASDGVGGAQAGSVLTFDADGLTIAWMKTATPAGTMVITALLFR